MVGLSLFKEKGYHYELNDKYSNHGDENVKIQSHCIDLSHCLFRS